MRAWFLSHRWVVAAVAVVVVAVGATTGVVLARGGGSKTAAAPPTTSPPPTTPPPTTAPPPKRPPPRPSHPINPLTGLPGMPRGPVVGLKVDNTFAARPQWGLNQADVVYVEQVEGGLTRLIAIYASRRPTWVGPIRSVRGSDPELLTQYGRMALGFSGGAANELASFHRSALIDASADARGGAYFRIGSRRAPYNLIANLAALSRSVAGAWGVSDVGFRWSTAYPLLSHARRVSRFTAVVGTTPISFVWNARAHRWVETAGGSLVYGADGIPLSTSDVLVQFCRVSLDYRDIDQAGSPAAYTHSIGSGRAVLFRDGRVIDGTWTRARVGNGTQFHDKTGANFLLRPGGVWVILAAAGSQITGR